MLDKYAQTRHLTTFGKNANADNMASDTAFGGYGGRASSQDAQSGTFGQDQADSSRDNVNMGENAHTDARDETYSTRAQSDISVLPHNDATNPVTHPSQGAQALDLNHEHEPRASISQGKRSSLASTEGPLQVPTTNDVSKSDIPPTSSVGQRNAPGRAGSVGETAMSALGYGGNTVERSKEEQGLGEKIVNFLGA
ncbi:hypothetical protein LTR70_009268 [Exophiala xenobiotica]|uniref:Uncharacterized protein n=1 Tax=Lithohypha guttulata TaxID=1690604 RepID=A0ABR0JYT0_9EURO|nr:hypothetical protein LTR24_009072 [Lithohypha guttulata]KAK5310733.1 hypothetical protein LTR70_009268 [Exophiala xenobiotica]